MQEDEFLKLIKAREGIKQICDWLELIVGDVPNGIIGETLDNIDDVISVYSLSEYNYVTAQRNGLCGDAYLDDYFNVLNDSTLTSEDKCNILYVNENK